MAGRVGPSSYKYGFKSHNCCKKKKEKKKLRLNKESIIRKHIKHYHNEAILIPLAVPFIV